MLRDLMTFPHFTGSTALNDIMTVNDEFERLMKEAPATCVKVKSLYMSVGETSFDFDDDDDDDEGCILSIFFTFNILSMCSFEQSLQLRYLYIRQRHIAKREM